MKIFRKIAYATLSILGSVAVFTSCNNDNSDIAPTENVINDEVLNNLSTLGLDGSNLTIMNRQDLLPGDPGNGQYLVEGDLTMTAEQIKSLAESVEEGGPATEQYSTNNLVDQNRTIRVMGYTGNNANGLPQAMRDALTDAVANYNALNMSLTFTLSFGVNFTPADIVVYQITGSAGGIAGFPYGTGDPFKFVRILSGTTNYSNDVLEHVITHEIGHCLGLRHTDYFDRSISCGIGGNEGDAGVGANHIPGTPTGADTNSIMLACFNTSVTGEFSHDDIDALEFLY